MRTTLVSISFLLLVSSACATSQSLPSQSAQSVASADAPFWVANVGTPAERFERAKQSEPELITFLRRMPKGADLHSHVSGAIYSDYLLDWVLDTPADRRLNYDLSRDMFTADPPYPGIIVSTDELVKNAVYLEQFLDSFSMRGWYPNTTNGHDHFFSTFPLIGSAKRSSADMVAEIVARNRYENVQYLELMVTSVPYSVVAKFTKSLDTFDAGDLEAAYEKVKGLIDDESTIDALKDYLDKRDRIIGEKLGLDPDSSITGNDLDLVIRYIPQLYRRAPLKDFFVGAVTAMMAIKHDDRVVGLNMVSPEDDPRSRRQFGAQMEILDYLWQRMGEPKITLHAGELDLGGSPVEPMRDRISRAIEQGHALRVGHAVSVAWEDDVVGLLEEMKDKGILVEICFTSNETILGVQGDAHPFLMYRRAGVPVSINTDDEGINRSNLTIEFVKAVQWYDLSYDEVKDLVRNSLEYSFLSGESLFKDRDYSKIPNEAFESIWDSNWQPTEAATKDMRDNPKLNRQVRLERAFVAFEELLTTGFTRRSR